MTIIVDMNELYAIRDLYDSYGIDILIEDVDLLYNNADVTQHATQYLLEDIVLTLEETEEEINNDLKLSHDDLQSTVSLNYDMYKNKVELWVYYAPSKSNYLVWFDEKNKIHVA